MTEHPMILPPRELLRCAEAQAIERANREGVACHIYARQEVNRAQRFMGAGKRPAPYPLLVSYVYVRTAAEGAPAGADLYATIEPEPRA